MLARFVILPNSDGGGFLVYVLASTTEPGAMVVGGHYRVTVSPDGRKIVQADALSRSCLTIKIRHSDRHVVATHEIRNAPIDTHVFLGLLHQIDIGVLVAGTKTMWIFSKGKMVSRKKLE